MYYGVDYYPEHWPKERWAEDARLMKEANLNLVRMAEFAWALMEPKKGEYDFTWLDGAIEIFAKEGIKTFLGTPTACPPKWLTDENPDIFMRDFMGNVRGFGTRRHYCYNNPTYHAYSGEIVAKMTEHYKDNPNIVGWQIDNEFGCHDTTRCYCPNCVREFQIWLKDKYKTIDELNRAWGTVFWSQTYADWEQIELPTYTVCDGPGHNHKTQNPGLLLDFYRFSSNSVVKYQKLQIDKIREVDQRPITHNLMGHFDQIDYFKLGKDLDFVSWDNYPSDQWSTQEYQSVAMAHDLMRGVKNKNFWVMEQQSGPCGWSSVGNTPKPGQIRLWTYQAIAHGADGIVYFRWRPCTFGTEQNWYGILDHDGIPRRRYLEIQQTGEELARLTNLLVGSENTADVALIKSYDHAWSHEFQPRNRQFHYNTLLYSYYKGLEANNLNTHVTSWEVDLAKYKLVVMPAFNLMTLEIEKRLRDYVAAGGHLVVTFHSGTKNWDNSVTTKTTPGYFRELAGVEVVEFDSLPEDEGVSVVGCIGKGEASIWCDILKPMEAKVLASYESNYYQGQPAITVNNFGQGKVFYVGCNLEQESLNKLVRVLASEAGVKQVVPWAVPGVEVITREQAGRPYLILLNHNGHGVTYNVGEEYVDALRGETVGDVVRLAPYDVVILTKEKGN